MIYEQLIKTIKTILQRSVDHEISQILLRMKIVEFCKKVLHHLSTKSDQDFEITRFCTISPKNCVVVTGLFVCLFGFNVAFNIICHIMTVSGCDREHNLLTFIVLPHCGIRSQTLLPDTTPVVLY